MGERLAAVVDLEQARRRRGRQVLGANSRRVSPGRRAPIREMVIDWEGMAKLDRREIAEIQKGRKPAPTVAGHVRRVGRPTDHIPAPAMSRAQRRLAWKAERRSIRKVAWSDSRAKDGQLAAVIPLRTRSLLRRLIYKAAA